MNTRRGYKKTRACTQIMVFVEHISVRGVKAYPDYVLIGEGDTASISFCSMCLSSVSCGLLICCE